MSSARVSLSNLAGKSDPEGRGRLKIMVVYADAPTRSRATRIYDHLTDALEEDYELHFTWWKFAFFEHSELYEAAVREALTADLILFCVHAADPLPGTVRGWIEEWRATRLRQGVPLLATLAGQARPVACPTALHAALLKLAREMGMGFSPGHFPFSAETPFCLISDRLDIAGRLMPLVEEVLTDQPVERMVGLND